MAWSWLIGNREFPPSELMARKWISVLWTLAPWSILVFSYKTNKDMGAQVPWRPPSGTYAIFWSLLIILLSMAWILVSRRADLKQFCSLAVLFLLLISLCIGWLFVYKKGKTVAISVILAILSVIGMALPISMDCDVYAGSLLMPLLVWVVFQLAVSCKELDVRVSVNNPTSQ
jgi:tryptophan-rich sensory protein